MSLLPGKSNLRVEAVNLAPCLLKLPLVSNPTLQWGDNQNKNIGVSTPYHTTSTNCFSI